MCFHMPPFSRSLADIIADMRSCTTPLHPHPVFLASAQPVSMETVSCDICCLVSCLEAEFCFLSLLGRGKAPFIYFFVHCNKCAYLLFLFCVTMSSFKLRCWEVLKVLTQSRAKPSDEVFMSEIFTLFHKILKIFPRCNLLHQSLNHVIVLYKIY